MTAVNLFEFLHAYGPEIGFETYRHALLVAECILVSSVVGLSVAMLTYRKPRWADLAVSTASVILTLPSLALLGLLISLVGLGVVNVFIALVAYAQLPIIRNATVGLATVDQAVVDAARGVGVGRLRLLLTIEFPLAWPVILTGIRVATQLILGIAAIAAYVKGPGLGNLIFDGLHRLGAVNSLNLVVAGVLGVVVLAMLFDLAFSVLGKLTTPRGVRV